MVTRREIVFGSSAVVGAGLAGAVFGDTFFGPSASHQRNPSMEPGTPELPNLPLFTEGLLHETGNYVNIQADPNFWSDFRLFSATVDFSEFSQQVAIVEKGTELSYLIYWPHKKELKMPSTFSFSKQVDELGTAIEITTRLNSDATIQREKQDQMLTSQEDGELAIQNLKSAYDKFFIKPYVAGVPGDWVQVTDANTKITYLTRKLETPNKTVYVGTIQPNGAVSELVSAPAIPGRKNKNTA